MNYDIRSRSSDIIDVGVLLGHKDFYLPCTKTQNFSGSTPINAKRNTLFQTNKIKSNPILDYFINRGVLLGL